MVTAELLTYLKLNFSFRASTDGSADLAGMTLWRVTVDKYRN